MTRIRAHVHIVVDILHSGIPRLGPLPPSRMSERRPSRVLSKRTRFLRSYLFVLLIATCSVHARNLVTDQDSLSSNLEVDIALGAPVAECNCQWPETPADPEALPTCASKPMMCKFCQEYVYQRYNFGSTGACDYFDLALRSPCVTLAEALEKKAKDIMKSMDAYVEEWGIASGASSALCQEFGCCTYSST